MLSEAELEKIKMYVEIKKLASSFNSLDELGVWLPNRNLLKSNSLHYPALYIKSPLEFSRDIARMKIGDVCDVVGWNYSKLSKLIVVSKITEKIYLLRRVSEFKRHNMPMEKYAEIPLRQEILESKQFQSKLKLINYFSGIVKIYTPKTGTNGGSLIYES